MRNDPIKLMVIVSSTRDGRLGPAVGQWFLSAVAEYDDIEVDSVDLLDYPLPVSLSASDEVVCALRPRVAAAEAFVIIAPEYNRSIPGPLKTLIDCYNPEWEAKPFGIVGYGLSISGGVRAAEHLRQILSEFHAVVMKDGVFFPAVLQHLDETDGTFRPRLEGSALAAKGMLEELLWWARALKTAKATAPYRG